MRLGIQKTGGTLVLSLTGELGHHEAIEMMAEIRSNMEHATENSMMLDMSGLSFMDSSGIAVALKAFKYAQDRGAEFCLKAPEGHIKKILSAAGLDKIIRFV